MPEDHAALRRRCRIRLAVVIAAQIGIGFPIMPLLPRLLIATNTMPDTSSWPLVFQTAFALTIHIGPAAVASLLVGCGLYSALGLSRLRRMVHGIDQVCPECEYSLVGISGDSCPECGTRAR